MTNTENKKREITLKENVVVVIPCYNGGEKLREAVAGALAHVRRVVVVDDGSTDGCMESVENLPVRVVRFERNRGKGHALIAGVRTALELRGTAAVALMDADGQHRASELPALFARHQVEAADLVIGARQFDRATVPWRSRFGNRLTVWVMGWLCGRHLPDTQCGFRLLSSPFARCFLERVPGGRYETEMRMVLLAIRGGFRIESVPIATIYEAGNPTSHFRKVRDSARIYWALAQVLFFGGDAPC